MPAIPSAGGCAPAVAGLLLTGGRSSRLGVDKARLATPDGETLATRTARLLGAVADPVVEVGPGLTGLMSVQEPDPQGPLGAVVAGLRALADLVGARPTLVVATDLPRLSLGALDVVAHHPSDRSVVPEVDGVVQVLCARYSPDFLAAAVDAFARGQRSLIRLVECSDAEILGQAEWVPYGGTAPFADVDTPDDLQRMISDGVLFAP